jgi:UDP-N-acetylmuramyl pentapeptide phosphotransferase/UDP-N-acetylglucosamine-1-phosphate transferase
MIIESIPHYLLLALSFFVSLLLSYVSIPPIVALARDKHLFDLPNKRGAHKYATPTLGGIAIFAGFVFSSLIFSYSTSSSFLPYLVAACILIFFVGLKDDIFVLSPIKKLMTQVIAAFIVVLLTEIRITDLHGVLGIREIPYIVSVLLSVFVIIAVTNAINLIDGIDGLAGSIGTIASITFGIWFYLAGRNEYVIICFALAGALLGFLRFNIAKGDKKIFMGDTGSLLTGFTLACIAIAFNQANLTAPAEFKLYSAPSVSIGIMFIPLWDTLRVMVIRIAKRKSPFKPDMQHVHHLLLNLGHSHIRATLILSSLSVMFIIFSFSLQSVGILWLLLIQCIIAIILYVIPFTIIVRKLRRSITINIKKRGRPKKSQD